MKDLYVEKGGTARRGGCRQFYIQKEGHFQQPKGFEKTNNHACSLGVLHYYIMALIIFLSCAHNKKKYRNKQRGRDIRHILSISPPQPATLSPEPLFSRYILQTQPERLSEKGIVYFP